MIRPPETMSISSLYQHDQRNSRHTVHSQTRRRILLAPAGPTSRFCFAEQDIFSCVAPNDWQSIDCDCTTSPTNHAKDQLSENTMQCCEATCTFLHKPHRARCGSRIFKEESASS